MDDLIEEIQNTNEEFESLLEFAESFQKISNAENYKDLIQKIDDSVVTLASISQMLDSLPDAIRESIEDEVVEYQEDIENKFDELESDTTDLLNKFESDIQEHLKSFENKALGEISNIDKLISMEWLTDIHEKITFLIDEITSVINKCDETVNRCETDIVDGFSQITDTLNKITSIIEKFKPIIENIKIIMGT